MRKIELLTELEKKFFKVGNVALADSSQAGQAVRVQEGVAWYIAGLYEQSGKTLTRRNIAFYVVDEGLPTEQAFYADREPTTALAAVVSKWSNVEGEVVREGKDFAVVRRFNIVADTATEVQVLVKDVNGVITEYPIA